MWIDDRDRADFCEWLADKTTFQSILYDDDYLEQPEELKP
jgi:hypothetical protein